MASSSCQPTTRWRNTERVTVLKHKIEELEEHTMGRLPNRALEFFGCGGCRPSPYTNLYSTTQLQFILLLEKELDDELRLPPLEYLQQEDQETNRITNYKKVLDLQKQISEIAKETDKDEIEGDQEAHGCCTFSLSTTTATNLLLLKEILTRRLKREMPTTIKSSVQMYSYGAIERPVTDLQEQQQEINRRLKKWKKDIRKLKSQQRALSSYGPHGNDDSVFYHMRSMYNSIKVQDLEDKIKLIAATENRCPKPLSEIVCPPPYRQPKTDDY